MSPSSTSAGRTARRVLRRRLHRARRPRWRRSPSPGWIPCCSSHRRRRSACRHSAPTAASASPAWRARAIPAGWTGTCRRSSGCCAPLGTPVVHYKVCSTFDSAPHIGSIGRAVDVAAGLFDGWIPMVVADPGMGRFQSFGHLFALAQGKGYRLDRHPTMSKHPVTPMDESDLGLHLAKQTDKADRPRRLRRHEARAGRCTSRGGSR